MTRMDGLNAPPRTVTIDGRIQVFENVPLRLFRFQIKLRRNRGREEFQVWEGRRIAVRQQTKRKAIDWIVEKTPAEHRDAIRAIYSQEYFA